MKGISDVVAVADVVVRPGMSITFVTKAGSIATSSRKVSAPDDGDHVKVGITGTPAAPLAGLSSVNDPGALIPTVVNVKGALVAVTELELAASTRQK